MPKPVRVLSWGTERSPEPDEVLGREWLVTNGLGGYASGTLAGAVTRRYHGLLVAALPAPLGRMVMLNHLSESVRLPDGTLVRLGGVERAGNVLELHGIGSLEGFRMDMGLPVWTYRFGEFAVEKRIHLVYRQNTVHVGYRLVSGNGTLRLKLRPAVHFRPHEAPVSEPIHAGYVLTAWDGRYELKGPDQVPPLRMVLRGVRDAFTVENLRLVELLYRVEADRGYEAAGDLWSPGYFRADLSAGSDVTLVASTEDWGTVLALDPEPALRAEAERRERLLALAPESLRRGVPGELVLAADQFIVVPPGRVEEAARARAAGDEVRTVIAGYHWFTDWGRDTMIGLEGLTLVTGRHREAGCILRTFADYVRDGLIPNMFPDGSNEGLYHTVDATLWFFHAVDRYLAHTVDRMTLRHLLPTLLDIVNHHVKGTRFGIGVDPADGLLRQGAQGYALTWMDAKCDGWVVTPRRGKPVEVNGLWYNALRLLEGWLREEGEGAEADRVGELAARTRESFDARFWFAEGGHCYDVVDGEAGDDPALRPNQVIAMSLRHPVLAEERWRPMLQAVRTRLLTPVGLRTLAPDHPDYKPNYHGDLRTRDAAYHQGTVWPWLAGPFVDAWLRANPDDRAGARRFVEGALQHLDDYGVGTIAEIFDAEAPFHPRGCVAQAWSVAEMLRCWEKTA